MADQGGLSCLPRTEEEVGAPGEKSGQIQDRGTQISPAAVADAIVVILHHK